MSTMSVQEALNYLYTKPTFKYYFESVGGKKYFTNGDGKLFDSKNAICGVYPEFDFDEYNEPKKTIMWNNEEVAFHTNEKEK